LQGKLQLNIHKLELAARLFPINRNIALGPAYYFLATNKATEQSLAYINYGLKYDSNNFDLIKTEMVYSFKLGKNDEALRAYARMALIAPNSAIVKQISNSK
jgi:hypothetical protein